NRSNADVAIDLAGDAGRRAEAELAEVRHILDGVLEPAESFRSDRLEHEAFDVDLHLFPQLVIELLAAAVLVPREPGEIVEAEAGSGCWRAEQRCRGMLAGPIVRPGEAAFDKALVDGIERVVDSDHCAR